jgi:hypothetical protein
VSSIQASSMAVTFLHKIVFRPGSKFCFGTISAVADEEGTLHRIADPTERRSSSKISVEIGKKQEKVQPPMLRKRIASCRTEAQGPPTRKTPLSTSPMEEWTQITRKKETNKIGRKQVVLSTPPPSKENRKKIVMTAMPFYPDVIFIGRVESPPHLRRRADRTRRGTSSAGIPPTKEPTPKYPETSRGRRAGPGAACVARRGLRDGRNP